MKRIKHGHFHSGLALSCLDDPEEILIPQLSTKKPWFFGHGFLFKELCSLKKLKTSRFHDKLCKPLRIARFVIIPRNYFHKGIVYHLCQF